MKNFSSKLKFLQKFIQENEHLFSKVSSSSSSFLKQRLVLLNFPRMSFAGRKQQQGHSNNRGGGQNHGRGRGNRYFSNSNPIVSEGEFRLESEERAGPSSSGGSGAGGSQKHANKNAIYGEKPPPGLRGKELGLWYKMKSQAKNGPKAERNKEKRGKREDRQDQEEKEEKRMDISLSHEKEQSIFALIRQLQTAKNIKMEDVDEDSLENVESELNLASEQVRHDFQKKYLKNLYVNAKADGSLVDSNKLQSVISSISLPSDQERDTELDLKLKCELEEKIKSNIKYKNMLSVRNRLPAYICRDQILELVEKNQILVLSGDTGCGKTTQIGQLILDRCISQGIGSITNIVCTQPRRISAISCAERVAEERGERLCESTGYSIRLESRLPVKKGSTLVYCTTGIILQRLKEDPQLKKISHIIVDEVHERDVYCDFLLAILKDIAPLRKDLKIIIMSATLNSEKFSQYFDNCPTYHIAGNAFNVEEFYLEDVLAKTHFDFGQYDSGRRIDFKKKQEFDEFIKPFIRKLSIQRKYNHRVINQLAKLDSEEINYDLIQQLIEYICQNDKSNNGILVFLPGWSEISSLFKKLQTSNHFPESLYIIIPLHSLMPTVNQKEVFNRPPSHKRKIVIATNIAETSITIDDIVFVIDSGITKINNYDIVRNIESLDNEFVAKANSIQRKGRAGRVQPGVCYHLYSSYREKTFEDYKKPEILRKRLEEVVLQIKSLGLGKAKYFLEKLLDSPKTKAIETAIERLQFINALDDNENLTPLGYHLSMLPMDPQSGKMILMAAIFGCLDPILSVAAGLSFKDPFYTPLGKEKIVDAIKREMAGDNKSDHLVLCKAIEGYEEAKRRGTDRNYCYQNFLSYSTINMLINFKGQFAQYLYDQHFISTSDYKDPSLNKNSLNIGLICGIICAGLYPNVAHVKKKGKCPLVFCNTKEDGRVKIHPKSINSRAREFESPFVVYHEKMQIKDINLFDTTMVMPFPLVMFGGKLDFSKKKERKGVKKPTPHMGVDQTIRFNCKESTFFIIQSLRLELDKLLTKKIENPGPTNWNEYSQEGALLRTIIDLITTEYNFLLCDYSSFEIDIEDEDDY